MIEYLKAENRQHHDVVGNIEVTSAHRLLLDSSQSFLPVKTLRMVFKHSSIHMSVYR